MPKLKERQLREPKTTSLRILESRNVGSAKDFISHTQLLKETHHAVKEFHHLIKYYSNCKNNIIMVSIAFSADLMEEMVKSSQNDKLFVS